MSAEFKDMLEEMFLRQKEFMELLREHDILPEWPIDLTTKPGQRIIKEYIFNMIEEIAEASFTLKNRVHKLSNDGQVDFEHYKEELVDALSYFMEICILSGISEHELFTEYCKKNAIVKERLESGY